MSGWCPSFSVCGMAVVCAAVVLPSAVVRLVPYSSHCSAGEYCSSCRALFHCRVCGVRVVSVRLRRSCGGVSSVRPPPRRGGGWGHHGWWGAIVMVGGMALKGGCVDSVPPVRVPASPCRVLASPLLFACGPC